MKQNIYPPRPKCRWPGESYVAFYRDPLGFLTRTAQACGDIAHMSLFGRHHYLLNHPDYIKEVLLAPQQEMNRSTPQAIKALLGKGLLTSQGEFHQRQRRLLQPAFHKERVAGYGSTMVEYTTRAFEPWRPETISTSRRR